MGDRTERPAKGQPATPAELSTLLEQAKVIKINATSLLELMTDVAPLKAADEIEETANRLLDVSDQIRNFYRLRQDSDQGTANDR